MEQSVRSKVPKKVGTDFISDKMRIPMETEGYEVNMYDSEKVEIAESQFDYEKKKLEYKLDIGIRKELGVNADDDLGNKYGNWFNNQRIITKYEFIAYIIQFHTLENPNNGLKCHYYETIIYQIFYSLTPYNLQNNMIKEYFAWVVFGRWLESANDNAKKNPIFIGCKQTFDNLNQVVSKITDFLKIYVSQESLLTPNINQNRQLHEWFTETFNNIYNNNRSDKMDDEQTTIKVGIDSINANIKNLNKNSTETNLNIAKQNTELNKLKGQINDFKNKQSDATKKLAQLSDKIDDSNKNQNSEREKLKKEIETNEKEIITLNRSYNEILSNINYLHQNQIIQSQKLQDLEWDNAVSISNNVNGIYNELNVYKQGIGKTTQELGIKTEILKKRTDTLLSRLEYSDKDLNSKVLSVHNDMQSRVLQLQKDARAEKESTDEILKFILRQRGIQGLPSLKQIQRWKEREKINFEYTLNTIGEVDNLHSVLLYWIQKPYEYLEKEKNHPNWVEMVTPITLPVAQKMWDYLQNAKKDKSRNINETKDKLVYDTYKKYIDVGIHINLGTDGNTKLQQNWLTFLSETKRLDKFDISNYVVKTEKIPEELTNKLGIVLDNQDLLRRKFGVFEGNQDFLRRKFGVFEGNQEKLLRNQISTQKKIRALESMDSNEIRKEIRELIVAGSFSSNILIKGFKLNEFIEKFIEIKYGDDENASKAAAENINKLNTFETMLLNILSAKDSKHSQEEFINNEWNKILVDIDPGSKINYRVILSKKLQEINNRAETLIRHPPTTDVDELKKYNAEDREVLKTLREEELSEFYKQLEIKNGLALMTRELEKKYLKKMFEKQLPEAIAVKIIEAEQELVEAINISNEKKTQSGSPRIVLDKLDIELTSAKFIDWKYKHAVDFESEYIKLKGDKLENLLIKREKDQNVLKWHMERLLTDSEESKVFLNKIVDGIFKETNYKNQADNLNLIVTALRTRILDDATMGQLKEDLRLKFASTSKELSKAYARAMDKAVEQIRKKEDADIAIANKRKEENKRAKEEAQKLVDDKIVSLENGLDGINKEFAELRDIKIDKINKNINLLFNLLKTKPNSDGTITSDEIANIWDKIKQSEKMVSNVDIENIQTKIEGMAGTVNAQSMVTTVQSSEIKQERKAREQFSESISEIIKEEKKNNEEKYEKIKEILNNELTKKIIACVHYQMKKVSSEFKKKEDYDALKLKLEELTKLMEERNKAMDMSKESTFDNADLQRRINALETDPKVYALQGKIERLEEGLLDKKKELDNSEEIQELKEKISLLNKEMAGLTKLMEEKNKAMDVSKESTFDNADLQRRINALETDPKVYALQGKIERLEKELLDKKKELDNSEENRKLNTEISLLKEEMAGLTKLMKEKNKAMDVSKESTFDNADLQRRINALEKNTKVNDLQEEINKLERKLLNKEKELDNSKEIRELKEKISQLNKEMADQQVGLGASEARIGELEKMPDVHVLQEELKKLEGQLSDEKKKGSDNNKEIKALNEKIVILQSLVTREKFLRVIREGKNVQGEIVKLQEELKGLEEKGNKADPNAIEILKDLLKDLEKYKVSQEELDNLKKRTTNLEDDKRIGDLQKNMTDLKSQLADLQVDKNAQEEIKALKERLKKLESANSAQSEIDAIKEELKGLQNAAKIKITKKINELKKSSKEMKDLSQLKEELKKRVTYQEFQRLQTDLKNAFQLFSSKATQNFSNFQLNVFNKFVSVQKGLEDKIENMVGAKIEELQELKGELQKVNLNSQSVVQTIVTQVHVMLSIKIEGIEQKVGKVESDVKEVKEKIGKVESEFGDLKKAVDSIKAGKGTEADFVRLDEVVRFTSHKDLKKKEAYGWDISKTPDFNFSFPQMENGGRKIEEKYEVTFFTSVDGIDKMFKPITTEKIEKKKGKEVQTGIGTMDLKNKDLYKKYKKQIIIVNFANDMFGNDKLGAFENIQTFIIPFGLTISGSINKAKTIWDGFMEYVSIRNAKKSKVHLQFVSFALSTFPGLTTEGWSTKEYKETEIKELLIKFESIKEFEWILRQFVPKYLQSRPSFGIAAGEKLVVCTDKKNVSQEFLSSVMKLLVDYKDNGRTTITFEYTDSNNLLKSLSYNDADKINV